MKVCIYFEGQEHIARSGIGRAMSHQLRALSFAGVETTTSFEECDVDLVHINTYWPKSYSLLRKCKKKGIPVIVHGHSTYEDFQNSFRFWKLMEPFYRFFLRRMYTNADFIITPTPYAAELLTKFLAPSQIKDISNGIDLEEYAADETKVALFREKFQLGDEPYVLGVGFPFVRKGIFDFIETARLLPDVRFLWLGSLQKILTEQKVLKAMKNAPKNVSFPGYCKGDLIKGGYQGALAVLFPTYEETEGIVALEALASKTPLIVRPIPVFSSWLTDKKNCYMGNTPYEFKNIISSLREKGKNCEILEEGWRVAEERSLFRVGEKLKETYEMVLSLKNKNSV